MSDYSDEEDELNRILEGRNDDYEEEEEEEVESKNKNPSKRKLDEDDARTSSAKKKNKPDSYVDDFIEVDVDNGYGVDYGDEEDDNEIRPDEAIEVKEKSKQNKPKTKRVVLNPQPRLNESLLTSKKGIVQLIDMFKDMKYKGKGYEKEYLDKILFKIEHWAHRLFPKMKFEDFVERVENLGSRRAVKTFVKKIRYDLPLNLDPEEDIIENFNDDDDDVAHERVDPEVAFDRLMETIEREKNQLPNENTNTSRQYDDDQFSDDDDILMNINSNILNEHELNDLNEESQNKQVIQDDIKSNEENVIESKNVINQNDKEQNSDDEEMDEEEILKELNSDIMNYENANKNEQTLGNEISKESNE